MTPKPGRSTDNYYIVAETTAKRELCWFCDEFTPPGSSMVKYLYIPSAPPRPVCPDCAKEIQP